MKFWAMDDRRGWGRALVGTAVERGYNAALFTKAEQVDSGVAFCRLDQAFPKVEADRAEALAVAARGLLVIPDRQQIEVYEDKWRQAQAFAWWTPETHLIATPDDAYKSLKKLDLPFVSKSKRGSASKNVRLIPSHLHAEAEIALAFGRGITAWGEPQHGYLIWQRFLAGNDYDYRAVINGKYCMLLRRYNRKDRPFASGSGITEPVNKIAGDAAGAFETALAFFERYKLTWCGIDLVRGPESWYVLETSFAWTLPAYHKCVYHGDPKGRTGEAQWDVMLDGLEAGIFG